MFARFDENPAMTLQDIKETNVTDGQTDGRKHTRTDNVKTVYPPQTKFAGGILTNLPLNMTENAVILHCSHSTHFSRRILSTVRA